MRIIKALAVFTVGLVLLAGFAFLVVREILLMSAVSQVRSSMTQLRRIAQNTGVYAQECRAKGGFDDTTALIETIQLRFDSPTSYVLEVICSQFTFDPIVVKSVHLPFFSQKTPGSSGLYWSNEDISGVGVEVLGRSRGVFMQGNTIWYDSADKTLGLAGPLTTCQGHGYNCCQEQTSMGSGTSISNVTDCPRSCFESCVLRPLVVSLTTQPFYDPATRQLSISADTSFEVGFVIDPQNAKELNVQLDFGDGTVEEFSDFQGRSSHAYSCDTQMCDYTMQVIAFNENGIKSAETTVSQVQVRVTR